MTSFLWERAPFFSNPGLLRKDCKTELPFSLGALSRLGSKHRKFGMNNQDAIHLDIQEHSIIGVLCDGTSSTDSRLERIFSNNEVSSNLTSFLLTQVCLEIIPQWQGGYSKSFVRYLDKRFKLKYKALITLLSQGHDSSAIAAHFGTSTCIGFIILKDQYLVFGAGDGHIIHNGKREVLKELPFITLSNINRKSPILSLLAIGETSELKQLALLSDGFTSQKVLEDQALMRFLKTPQDNSGFHDVSADFHVKVLNKVLENLNDQWPSDDASCIILRPVKNKKK